MVLKISVPSWQTRVIVCTVGWFQHQNTVPTFLYRLCLLKVQINKCIDSNSWAIERNVFVLVKYKLQHIDIKMIKKLINNMFIYILGLLAGLWEFPSCPVEVDASTESCTSRIGSYLAERLSLTTDTIPQIQYVEKVSWTCGMFL